MPRVSPCFCFWLCSFHSFCLATMRRKMMALMKTRERHSCADTLLPQLGTLGLPALRKEFLKLHHLLSRGTEFGGHAAVADLEWVGPRCCGPPPGKTFCGVRNCAGSQNSSGTPHVAQTPQVDLSHPSHRSVVIRAVRAVNKLCKAGI